MDSGKTGVKHGLGFLKQLTILAFFFFLLKKIAWEILGNMYRLQYQRQDLRSFQLSILPAFSEGKKNNPKVASKIREGLRPHQWVLPCTCCLPSTSCPLTAYVTAHTPLPQHAVHNCMCSLKGACCHVVLHGCPLPLTTCTYWYTFLSLGVFLCIIPPMHMLLPNVNVVTLITSLYQCQVLVKTSISSGSNDFQDYQ